jgi:Kef-type K+ transport system membrane component KefB
MNIEQLIVSIGAIMLAARVSGFLFGRIGQPQIVGEMVAGILLGPSFLGRVFPFGLNHIFPVTAIPNLNSLSQLGLLLFMFVVGLEVDPHKVAKHRAVVVLASNFSILLPLALGMALAAGFYQKFAGAGVAFLPFALFMGTAMSVTAFPVLAGILKERNLLNSDLGSMAISCAAVDDVSAWLLLAILMAIVHAARSWFVLFRTLFLLLLFVIAVFWLVPRAAVFLERSQLKSRSGLGPFCGLVIMMLAASWTTEWLGVHALFGAFVTGLAMPKESALVSEAINKLESTTLTLLLPIFFVLTGLRTRIDLLSGPRAWACTLAIIGVATLGKLGGATFIARARGVRWRDAFSLGILMNSRGLVELVILNAGLESGILSSSLFAMMVIMALFTTFMTTPVLIGISRISDRAERPLLPAQS